MHIACLDLEGVLLPEIWVAVAKSSGIDALCATTQDYRDYDELMKMRLTELARHGIGLPEVQATAARLAPLPGAPEFLDALRRNFQVTILSDTFYEMALPLMEKLGQPFLLCHHLESDAQGKITGYRLRQPEPKRHAVQALHSIHCRVIAAGDSYNDIPMLEEADAGILFCAPEAIRSKYPAFTAVSDYAALEEAFLLAAQHIEEQGSGQTTDGGTPPYRE